MKLAILARFVSCSILAIGVSAKGTTNVTPLQKVIQLLTDMAAQGKAALQDEETKLSAYQQWCVDYSAAKKKSISESDEQIGSLKATIYKCEVDVDQLSQRINVLSADIDKWKLDQNSASGVRKRERRDFQATNQDYSESVDALERAIEILKQQDNDKAQAQLLQIQKLPLSAKKALSAFLQRVGRDSESELSLASFLQRQDPEATYSAPEAKAYEFQSGGIIDMLQKLRTGFRQQINDLQAEELNANHAYESIMQQLKDNIEIADGEIKRLSKRRALRLQDKADAVRDLSPMTADRDEDVAYYKELQILCNVKISDFKKRQEMRTQELETIEKTIEILSSDAVSAAAKKHLPSLIQTNRKQTSLVEFRSSATSPLQQRVSDFLSSRAQEVDSKLLALVAQKVTEDPFKKVLKMIKDLIVKLMEEGTAETEHKGWCDTELATNKQTRDERSADVQSLRSKVDEFTADLSSLAHNIKLLQAAVAELDMSMSKAADYRTTAKAKNEGTIKEAKAAADAVSQAMAILKEFYAQSGEALLMQQGSGKVLLQKENGKLHGPEDDAPASFDSEYKGMQSQGGGVIDFLEVIAADFSRLAHETNTEEVGEEEEYGNFLFEAKKDKALKQQEIEQMTEKRTYLESQLQSTKSELVNVEEELNAAMNYYEKLKPQCEESGITYEERVKRREAELQSLKEALKILQGETIAL